MQMSTLILVTIEAFVLSFGTALFHMFFKLDSLSKTYRAMKQEFSTKEFFYDERFAISANTTVQVILLFFTPIIATKHPELEYWIIGINGLAGFSGSSLFSKLFGKASEKANKMIDEKIK